MFNMNEINYNMYYHLLKLSTITNTNYPFGVTNAGRKGI